MKSFPNLRKDNPLFIYEDVSLEISDGNVIFKYHFIQPNLKKFNPSVRVPLPDNYNVNIDVLRSFAFHIGMIEMASYWKACCSPKIIIKPFKLTPSQEKFYKHIYFYGMSEFIFVNKIIVNPDEMVNFECDANNYTLSDNIDLSENCLIPVGGGKDSVVTMELLHPHFKDSKAFIINPTKASIDTATTAGFSDSKQIIINRNFDRGLLDLNKDGYLNGHTPYSVLVAFISAVTAYIHGFKYIPLSNEASASEGNITWNNMNVNHQYSKSYEAELLLSEFISENFNKNLKYFSFLRPIYELKIAKIFSRFPKHFENFRSCNRGSKLNVWCGDCPKCLFVAIILSPFLSKNDIIKIFGYNILDNKELESEFLALLGLGENKPLECVGTYGEVKTALSISIVDINGNNLPYLLRLYKEKFSSKVDDIYNKRLEILDYYGENNYPSKIFKDILLKSTQ